MRLAAAPFFQTAGARDGIQDPDGIDAEVPGRILARGNGLARRLACRAAAAHGPCGRVTPCGARDSRLLARGSGAARPRPQLERPSYRQIQSGVGVIRTVRAHETPDLHGHTSQGRSARRSSICSDEACFGSHSH